MLVKCPRCGREISDTARQCPVCTRLTHFAGAEAKPLASRPIRGALIVCTECNGQLSDKASACPHCGAPVEQAKTWTETKPGKIGRPLNAAATRFGVASLVLLFVMPPVGFVMLMFVGLISLGKVAVFKGKCPNCAGDIYILQSLRTAPCPLCQKYFLSRDGRFYEA